MISTADSFRGQERTRRLLDGYLAQRRLAGTLLLLGERGLGKTTLAGIIARALTCERNVDNPRLWFCGQCYACKSIARGEQPEYVVVRPRGQDISVKQIEDDYSGFRSALLHPALLSHRVFVIDEAHHLNEYTSNQMLKLFEEAPARTVFMLVTDKPELLLPTILSRGQKFRLRPESAARLALLVEQDASATAEAAQEAAQMAAGRYVEAMALAADDEWRQAVKQLAGVLYTGRGSAAAAGRLAEIELGALWSRCLRDMALDAAAAEKQIRRGKSDAEKGLKVRRNELTREALVTAYDRATWWALAGGPPPAGFAQALWDLKLRINQNVDRRLAQTVFELTLSDA